MVKLRLHPPLTASLLAVSVLVCAMPVAAQRIALADRVTALEQHAAETSAVSNSANIERINQITELRTELRELRGQIETLQQQNEQLRATLRSQYLDLDDRLQTLEGPSDSTMPPPLGAAPIQNQGTPRPAPEAETTPAATTIVPSTDDVTGDAAVPAPDPADERPRYEAALDALKSGRYSESLRLFQAFLQHFPNGEYAANALYWLGESYYVVGDYAKAKAQFEAVIAQHPEHDKTPGALLKIGLSQHGQKHYDDAEATLSEVGRRHPGTDAARIAADRLRAIQLSRLQ